MMALLVVQCGHALSCASPLVVIWHGDMVVISPHTPLLPAHIKPHLIPPIFCWSSGVVTWWSLGACWPLLHPWWPLWLSSIVSQVVVSSESHGDIVGQVMVVVVVVSWKMATMM